MLDLDKIIRDAEHQLLVERTTEAFNYGLMSIQAIENAAANAATGAVTHHTTVEERANADDYTMYYLDQRLIVGSSQAAERYAERAAHCGNTVLTYIQKYGGGD